MTKLANSLRFFLLLVLALLLAGCSAGLPAQISEQVERIFPPEVRPTRTPFQPVPPTPIPTLTLTPTLAPTPTPEPVTEISVWVDRSVPEDLRAGLRLPPDTILSESEQGANLVIGAMRGGGEIRVDWVYALVAPFPTLEDYASIEEVQRAYRGQAGTSFQGALMMTSETRDALSVRWGPPGEGRLIILETGAILDEAWNIRSTWAIVPFEDLVPRWKVLRVNGLSPLDRGLNLNDYPLALWFGAAGGQEALQMLQTRMAAAGMASAFPPSNRDESKLTVLAMTGVTALTRATAYKMDTLGTTYPGRDIGDILRSADITHISHEVSLNPECPLANFAYTGTLFCGRPEYIELLEYIGTDVVELTGNHNNDHGRPASRYSLDMYAERGWQVFGGGENIEAAREPATLEHNGNRIAFIGCNPVGPPGAWATADQPGAAPCDDYEWMLERIRQLRADGYLPVVTFQYAEGYTFFPTRFQEDDFRAAVDAGAAIVSGSQAHFPQALEFYQGGLIHYGLGNLFFDQMDEPVVGTRREFIDRHYFYEGRHISTELVTAMLEDYARPRPMDEAERAGFLTDIFGASGW
jgi:poly-gamma-glutamate synthesis protein (capsule biosynthesis protein)